MATVTNINGQRHGRPLEVDFEAYSMRYYRFKDQRNYVSAAIFRVGSFLIELTAAEFQELSILVSGPPVREGRKPAYMCEEGEIDNTDREAVAKFNGY